MHHQLVLIQFFYLFTIENCLFYCLHYSITFLLLSAVGKEKIPSKLTADAYINPDQMQTFSVSCRLSVVTYCSASSKALILRPFEQQTCVTIIYREAAKEARDCNFQVSRAGKLVNNNPFDVHRHQPSILKTKKGKRKQRMRVVMMDQVPEIKFFGYLESAENWLKAS